MIATVRFIQWRRRAYKGGGEALYAYLAESKRVEGNPKSIIVGYLGSISSTALECKDRHDAFWQQVRNNLADHALSKEDLTRLEEAIAKRVPLKSKALAALISSDSQEWYTHVTEAIALYRGDSKGLKMLEATAIKCIPHTRIRFYKVDGESNSPIPACAFYYLGEQDSRFREVFGSVGQCFAPSRQ